tara:strand:- start:554 stop:1234 length:681 start_codon:yes stop_codon:yes gene_type:complete
MEEIRWVLIISGIALIAGIIIYESYLKSILHKTSKESEKIEPTFHNESSPDSPKINEEQLGAHSDNNIDIEIDIDDHNIKVECDHVITVRLTPIDTNPFDGNQVLEILNGNGLSLDDSGIFNYLDKHNKTKLFSAANLVEPGVFDAQDIENQKIPGLSFFMLMPLSSNEINAFDEMMMVLKKIKTSLKAELLDDAGSTLSIQRERYIREEVIEYMLKSKKNSPTYD